MFEFIPRMRNEVKIWPEVSTSDLTANSMLAVYATVIGREGALYCSSPVTSGRRFIDWLERKGMNVAEVDGLSKSDKKSHFNEVIRPNCFHASEVVQKLRERTAKAVIDPTAMPHLPQWTQSHWRSFWHQVIEQYADTALFVEDWQYSNGCVYEFWVAQMKGIPTVDEQMRPLSLDRGVDLISEARAEMNRHGVSTMFLEQVLRDLKQVSPALGGPSEE